MSDLASRECIPCQGGVPKLEGADIATLYGELGGEASGWKVVEDHHLEREFRFPDFKTALEFTNRVGALAEEQAHHPDIHLAWGSVTVQIWTHKIDGLVEADFIFAAKANQIPR
ncbi:MAG: 4a-hydroxytetrahydrobiopterin dehydratase [Candidatus Eisenbacteria bacterium]